MWNFLPGGLLMPAAVPMDLVDPKFTHDGEFDLQVRGRVRSHLENFIRDYMEPGTYSEIQETPEMDYNCRFYTTRDHYAWAMGKAIAAIDYEKFKPTAEDKNPKDGKPLYKDGAKYHDVLNAIWGTVTRLGSPGGIWAEGGSGWGATYKSVGSAYKATGESGWGRIDKVDYPTVSRGLDFDDDEDFDFERRGADLPSGVLEAIHANDPDFMPDEEAYLVAEEDRQWFRDRLLEEANTFNVPLENWRNYFTAAEFALIEKDYKRFLEARRTQARRNRKQRRRARNQRLSGL